MKVFVRYVWVWLLLMHYFFLWTFASESPPDIWDTIKEPVYEDAIVDSQSDEEVDATSDLVPVVDFGSIDEVIDSIQVDENTEEAITITANGDITTNAWDIITQSDPQDEFDDVSDEDAISDQETSNEEEISDTNTTDQTDVDTVDTDTWSAEPSQPLPSLIITEVAFAGIQEWIEIYNPHDTSFAGTIEIQWVRSSSIIIDTMTIPAKTARIIARQPGVETIADPTLIHSIHSMSMADGSPLHISLLVDGEVVDIFSASLDLMNQANKSTSDRSSLQRTLDDISIVHVSPPQQNYNNNSTMNINPGIVYHSIHDTPPAACHTRWTDIQIREVFWGSGDYDPYIELFIPQSFNQTITIAGSQMQEEFTVFVQQPAWQYHVISLPEHDYTIHPYTSDNQKLSFRWELGNIAIYWQDWQVLDKVDMQVKEDGYASYISGQWCDRVWNIVDNFSPGFSRDYFVYFPQGVEKIITVTEQIMIPWEPQQCENTSVDDDGWIESEEQEQEWNETILSWEIYIREDINLHIIDVWYQWPTTEKTITLYMTGTTWLDLVWFYLLTNGASKRNLEGIIRESEPLILTGSWWFSATQPRCVELLHNDTDTLVFDTYCYDPIEDSKRTGDIEISNIVYQTDPGSNIRQLHLFVPEWEVDLSQERYIMINTTKRNLTNYGIISGHTIIEWTFPFPKTKDTCIQLRQYDTLFHTYCYQVPQSTQNNNNEANEKPFNTNRLNYDIQIVDVWYKWSRSEKTISFMLYDWSVVDLSHFHILINQTTKRNLRWILEPNEPLTITGSLWFSATQARCVELFHKEHLFDTYCYDPAEDKQKEQQERMWTGSLTITDIIYDVEPDDQSITFTVSGDNIIFAHEWYLMINNRKFNLASFWSGSWGVVLTGNFRFPKTVEACISIGQYETIFDTYCYNQKQPTQEKQIVYTGISLEIVAAFPNPIWPDAGKEWLDIMLHNPHTVDLSQWFSILINGRTKRSISGHPVAWEVYRLTGTFVLPNSASCFSILYQDDILDTFCYPQTREGVIYKQNAETLLALTDTELSLLNATRLTRFDNRLCLTLSDVTIKCRAIPAGRLASRQMQELQLSRNYITTLHDYLYNSWQILYFNTDLVHYKTLYDRSKKDISAYQFTRQYGSEYIPVADIQTRFQLQYQQPLLQQMQSSITSHIFGEKLASNYQKAKEKYYTWVQ